MQCICGSGHDSGLHEQAVNKTRIGSLGSDRTVDQSGLRIGSDRIGLVFSLLVEKNYFEKSCFYATGGRNKKSEFSQQESNL